MSKCLVCLCHLVHVFFSLYSYFGYLGITVDEEKNAIRGEEIAISTANSRTPVLVIPTNEELAIARETLELVK